MGEQQQRRLVGPMQIVEPLRSGWSASPARGRRHGPGTTRSNDAHRATTEPRATRGEGSVHPPRHQHSPPEPGRLVELHHRHGSRRPRPVRLPRTGPRYPQALSLLGAHRTSAHRPARGGPLADSAGQRDGDAPTSRPGILGVAGRGGGHDHHRADPRQLPAGSGRRAIAGPVRHGHAGFARNPGHLHLPHHQPGSDRRYGCWW